MMAFLSSSLSTLELDPVNGRVYRLFIFTSSSFNSGESNNSELSEVYSISNWTPVLFFWSLLYGDEVFDCKICND